MKYTFEHPYELVTLDRFSKEENIVFSKREFKAGHKVPVHWHDYNEIEILAFGTLEHMLNNETYIMEEGDGYIASSCDFHGLRALSDVTLLNLSFKIGSVDELISSSLGYGIGKFRCRLFETELCRVIELFEYAISEKCEKSSDRFTSLMQKNIAEEIIITVLRASPNNLNVNTPPLIHRTIVEINTKFRQQVTLTSIAESLFVTPNYLGACFKKNMGMTFNHYLNLTRLRHACGLLCSTVRPVKEIAFECGFCSVEYFLYTFRKYLGMTPTDWRRRQNSGK